LGWTYFRAKQYPNALQALQEAVRLNPEAPETHYWIGEVFFYGTNEAEKALAAYRESLRLRPDEARTLNQIGLVYTHLRQFSEAEAAFRRAIELKPDVALYRSNLGLLYVRMGSKERALQVHDTLQRINPGLARALRKEIDEIFMNDAGPEKHG
jgi:Flp pilus assembly protein TadD